MTVSGGYGQLRASDADRDSVHTLLQSAYSDGRLTWDEFDQRSTALMQAKTYDQLTALTGDLRRPVVQPRPQYPPAVNVAPPTNKMAIVALSFGVGQIFLWVIGGVIAIVCGHMARAEIKRTGEQGDAMALVGLTLGYLGVLLPILFVLTVLGFLDIVFR